MAKIGQRGAIAAGHELTAKAGGDVLASGGNAADAAIAAAWMACVCEPVLASPGGGGFAMVRTPDGAIELQDFFVQTPSAKNGDGAEFREIHADFGTATQAFHIGQGTSAAPGFVPGLKALHRAYASRNMAGLAREAIRTAREGHRISAFQGFLAGVVAPILTAREAASELFAPGGQLIAEGDDFANPALAGFIEKVTRRDEWPGDEILNALCVAQSSRGHLRETDFTSYQVQSRQPLQAGFNGADIFLNPPPSAGGLMIRHALERLERPDLKACAKALAETDALWRAPDSPLRAQIAACHAPAYRGTTHISVVDGDGMAVSMTLSNGEGNGELVGDFGFMLNNMLGEEDVNPDGALGWHENQRLSSMMCPIIAKRGDELLVMGSGGSNRIRSALFHVLNYAIGQDMELGEAIRAARLHVERDHVDVEGESDDTLLRDLKSTYGSVRQWPAGNLFFGGCHAVGRDSDGRFHGSGDPRRAGVALIV